MFRTQDGWIQVFQERRAYWLHDGNVLRPHTLLTSGNHSPGFINCSFLIKDIPLLGKAASDLMTLFVMSGGELQDIDCVVGPQTGATKLAAFMSHLIADIRNRPCRWASPAKVGEGKNKVMLFKDPNHMLQKGDRCLMCEDVVTTGGTIDLTIQATQEAGGVVLPYIMALANRSGHKRYGTRHIVALIDVDKPIWTPIECQLCAHGSRAVRPKDNWELLNKAYS